MITSTLLRYNSVWGYLFQYFGFSLGFAYLPYGSRRFVMVMVMMGLVF